MNQGTGCGIESRAAKVVWRREAEYAQPLGIGSAKLAE